MENVWKKLYLAVLSAILAGPGAFAQNIDEAKIDSYLLHSVSEEPDIYHSVVLVLEDRVDIMALEEELLARRAGLEERAYEVITRLQAKAAATQPDLLEKLKKEEGIRPGSIQPFWITNIIILEAKGPAIARLSLDKAIGQILPNPGVRLVDEEGRREAAAALENNAEPGLSAIGANQMWAMGYTGYGRKALIIDTGQEPGHPALHNQFLYHNRDIGEAWRGSTNPEDCDSHGSHVTGTVLGLDRLARDTIGVAFDAKWMGGIGLGGGCSSGADVAGVISMFQWALNPDGNPSTIDDMPDVINNSWRNMFPSSGDCGNHFTYSVINALMTAGVAVVFAAGNEGPTASTIGDPPMNNTSLVRVFSVGSVNGNIPSFPISDFSSRGPTVCGGQGSLLIKPEVSAPGGRVRSSVINGGYAYFDGTSMAAPHTSGAVLLLKEAFPYLTGEEILLALYFSATDLGAPGEDNSYGMGIVNVPAAYQYLIGQGNEPVPPADGANDVILLQAEIPGLNCAGQASARLLVENDGTEAITSMDIQQYLIGNVTADTASFRWEGLLEPGGRQYIQMPPLQSVPGEYEYVANIVLANGQSDARWLNNQLKTRARIIADEFIEAQVSDNYQPCQGGQALLQSLYDGQGEVRWYDEPVDGSLLGEGRNALLPVADEPLTVYMEVAPVEMVGRPDNVEGTTQYSTDAYGLSFDAYSAFTIKSVKVYTEEAGSRLLILEGPNGYSFTKIVPMGVGEQRVELNLHIEPGEGWVLRLRAGKPLGLSLGGSDYPYVVPNVLSINRSTQSLIYYNYFYDWEVEYSHYCGRTPVEVEIMGTENTPQVAFNPADAEIDLSSGLNEVSFTDQSQGGTSWLWDFGDGATSTMQNPTHTYADTGIYQVTLTVIGQEGCANSTSGTVTVTETNVSAVSRLAEEYGMEVFPNPAREQFYLSLSLPQPRAAEVFLADMLGRPVWRRQLEIRPGEVVEIPAAGLAPGLYSVVVRLDGKQIGRRVVVN